MKYLTFEQVLLIHSTLVDETGGTHGLRERGSLLSAIELPKQTAFGAELYPTIFEKCAVYVRSIIANHPFLDGNKRTAVSVGAVFLSINGCELVVETGKIAEFAYRIIEEKLDIPEIADWFLKNSEKIK